MVDHSSNTPLDELLESDRTSHRLAAIHHPEITCEQLIRLANSEPRSLQVKLAAINHVELPEEDIIEVLKNDTYHIDSDYGTVSMSRIPHYEHFGDGSYGVLPYAVRFMQGDPAKAYNHKLTQAAIRAALSFLEEGKLGIREFFSLLGVLTLNHYLYSLEPEVEEPRFDDELYESMISLAIQHKQTALRVFSMKQSADYDFDELLKKAEKDIDICMFIPLMLSKEEHRIRAVKILVHDRVCRPSEHASRRKALSHSQELVNLANRYKLKLEKVIEIYRQEGIHEDVEFDQIFEAIKPNYLYAQFNLKDSETEVVEDYYTRKTGIVIAENSYYPLKETAEMIMEDILENND